VADDALFPEPEAVPPRTDGPWLVAPAPGCWRYMILGEDGQFLMIDGHGIRDSELVDVIRGAGVAGRSAEPGWAADWGDVARRTWARRHDMCPHHLAYVEGCSKCCAFRNDEGPWWDWSTEPDTPVDANRDRPGYFPVTVIDLEG
jgi:hypothetical protein